MDGAGTHEDGNMFNKSAGHTVPPRGGGGLGREGSPEGGDTPCDKESAGLGPSFAIGQPVCKAFAEALLVEAFRAPLPTSSRMAGACVAPRAWLRAQKLYSSPPRERAPSMHHRGCPFWMAVNVTMPPVRGSQRGVP